MARHDPGEIAPEVQADLDALALERGRPLVAVDADEVLVVFVDHLKRYLGTIGYEMRLVRYELEGSMFERGSDDPLPFKRCIELIDGFFGQETERQEAVPGGRETLARLADHAQIVILTNVPRHAAAARRANLDALGLDYPMIVNSGGKGRAMAWLAARAAAPTAFIDDSVGQIESVAKHASDTFRLHFAWADFIHRIYPECAHASAQVRGWEEAEARILDHLGR